MVVAFFSRGRLILSAGDREVEIEVEAGEMMSVRRLVQARFDAEAVQVIWLN